MLIWHNYVKSLELNIQNKLYKMILEPLFYVASIIPIYYQLNSLFIGKFVPAKTFSELRIKALIVIFYAVWMFVGIFTSQWVFFLCIIFLSFVPKESKWYKIVSAAITLVVIICMLLNKYFNIIY